ncbi:MAG: SWIM zinc finger family protein [Pseudonocardiaceae bacterium]
MDWLRLTVLVAVRLDADALLASLGQDLSDLGQEQLRQGRVGDLEAEDGGASAVLADPDRGHLEVWVGVVNGALTGECDCAEGASGGLCGHAVAVALAALGQGLTFSSIPSRVCGLDPEEQRFAEIAAELAPRNLIGLVARHAVADRYFAALLLACADRLSSPGAAEIHAARRVVVAAADVPNGRRWDLHDIVKAGTAMVAELELLAVRPPTDESLAVVEEAIAVWATLSGYLHDAWETYETEPEEIGADLAELHLRLCEVYRPDPLALASRLAAVVRNAEVDTFLDVPKRYADVLGAQGVAEFEALLAQLYR